MIKRERPKGTGTALWERTEDWCIQAEGKDLACDDTMEERRERDGKHATALTWKLAIRVKFAAKDGQSRFTHSSKCMHFHGRERETLQCSSISPADRNIWRASLKSPTQRRGIYLHLQIAHNMPGASGTCSAIYIWIPWVLGRWCFNLGIFAAAQWIQTEPVPQLWSGGYHFLFEGIYIHIWVIFSGKQAQNLANNFVGHYIAHNAAHMSSPCRTSQPSESL